MTLDDIIPRPHFRECHEQRVAAPPPFVWEALHDLRMANLRLSRTLMAGLRGEPRRSRKAGS